MTSSVAKRNQLVLPTADQLRAFLKQKRLTQRALCAEIGCQDPRLSEYLNHGKTTAIFEVQLHNWRLRNLADLNVTPTAVAVTQLPPTPVTPVAVTTPSDLAAAAAASAAADSTPVADTKTLVVLPYESITLDRKTGVGPRTGSVYIMYDPNRKGQYKIGRATVAERREKSFKTGNYQLRMVFSIEVRDYVLCETVVSKRLDQFRTPEAMKEGVREWYTIDRHAAIAVIVEEAYRIGWDE